jgi:hypothetical protein
MNEKPLYVVSRQGRHIFLTLNVGVGTATIELDVEEALNISDDLRSFAFDMEFEEE